MTKEDEVNFQLAKKSLICINMYDTKDDGVEDYCHVTDKYRRSADQSCNVNF